MKNYRATAPMVIIFAPVPGKLGAYRGFEDLRGTRLISTARWMGLVYLARDYPSEPVKLPRVPHLD